MKKEDKYNKILDAFQDLLNEKNIDAISVSEIARKAEIAKGSIYYYFDSKDKILDGLIERKFAVDVAVAIFAFGINSGAYVAEIIRGGIMSIPEGQFEAGRSLGFNYFQTMIYIVIPQVFKAVLPALCNEFIVLIKETSVAGYIGIVDLTKAGDLIRGRTFSAFLPLFAVAGIYLVLVVVLTSLVGKLERRLRQNER